MPRLFATIGAAQQVSAGDDAARPQRQRSYAARRADRE
jgi:hypothetical protein